MNSAQRSNCARNSWYKLLRRAEFVFPPLHSSLNELPPPPQGGGFIVGIKIVKTDIDRR
jgi:hypothetical protein